MKSDVSTASMGDEPWLKDLHEFMSRCPAYLVRLRGLPYECTAEHVLEFFRRGERPCDVMGGERGVFFVKRSDGKATGDAYVQFDSEATVVNAMTKHKQLIGVRYIELFRVAYNDVEQVIRRTLEAKNKPPMPKMMLQQAATAGGTNAVLLSHLQQQAPLPCSPVRDCVRFRGLPYEAQVQDILGFMGIHGSNIYWKGVHMIFNHMGLPSGEAVVHMKSEAMAAEAALHCNNNYMVVGKKQRFIEVCQLSSQEVYNYLIPASGITSPGPELMPAFFQMMSPMEPFPPASPVVPAPSPGHMIYVLINPAEAPYYALGVSPEWVSPDYPSSPVLSHPGPIHQQMPLAICGGPPDYYVN